MLIDIRAGKIPDYKRKEYLGPWGILEQTEAGFSPQ